LRPYKLNNYSNELTFVCPANFKMLENSTNTKSQKEPFAVAYCLKIQEQNGMPVTLAAISLVLPTPGCLTTVIRPRLKNEDNTD